MTDCGSIDLFVHGIPEDDRVHETFEMFMISISLDWISDEEFKLSDKNISLYEMENGIIKFSDRKSAMKFKNIFDKKTVNKRISGFDELRNFFMEFSSAEELYKLFDKIKSISTNDLYY